MNVIIITTMIVLFRSYGIVFSMPVIKLLFVVQVVVQLMLAMFIGYLMQKVRCDHLDKSDVSDDAMNLLFVKNIYEM